MRIWFGLLLAPVLALADQSVAYAAAGWACANQQVAVLHGVHAAALAAVALSAALAWASWRSTQSGTADGEALAVRHFLAGLATASALLSALAIVAMWVPVWALSPCLA